jgi:hypothetical protein
MNRAIGVPDKEAGMLSFAKTPHQAILIRVTCYTTSLYVIDFTCALNFGDAQPEEKGCWSRYSTLFSS